MKNDKVKFTSLLVVLVLGLSLFMSACSNDIDDDDDDMGNTDLMAVVDFESDSDNGIEWSFEQYDELFYCEDSFSVDESADEGAEMQSFSLFPKKAGDTTIRFSKRQPHCFLV